MPRPLPELRDDLDRIDEELVRLLAERFRVTQEVGEFKRDNGLPPVDPTREAAQFERIDALATGAGLNPDFAKKFLRLIIDEVVVNHTALQAGSHQ